MSSKLPATTTASSASTCRSWSYHASGPCTSHAQIRLLQLSPCWPTNLDTECTPESPERCSATHLSVQTLRSRRQFSATVTLTTHTVACAVQTMPTYVQSQPWSSTDQWSREHRHCYSNTIWLALCQNYQLSSTKALDQVRWASLFVLSGSGFNHNVVSVNS